MQCRWPLMSDRPVRPKYCQYQSVQSGILFFPLSVSWGSTSLVPLIVGISNCSYLLSYIQYIRYCQQKKSRYQTEMKEVHGATRKYSRGCPQFPDIGNSQEFSIQGGPVYFKAWWRIISNKTLDSQVGMSPIGSYVSALTSKGRSVCSFGSTGGGYCVWLFHIKQKILRTTACFPML